MTAAAAVAAATRHNNTAQQALDELLPMDELAQSLFRTIHVDIVSSANKNYKSSISFRFDALLSREREMKATAAHFGIRADRWNGSRLYKMLMQQQQQQQANNVSGSPLFSSLTTAAAKKSAATSSNNRNRIVLHPESECAEQNYSQTLVWQPWMTNLLHNYYRTGQLSVPAECRGYDLLLALEYFQILYQPDQLHFSSYRTYHVVQHWSDYFTHRCAIGDYVADCILRPPSSSLSPAPQQQQQRVFVFGTTADPALEDMKLRLPDRSKSTSDNDDDNDDKAVTVLPLLSVDPTNESVVTALACQASAAMVCHCFLRRSPKRTTKNEAAAAAEQEIDWRQVAALMRQDFRDYLTNILTHIQVEFTLQPVKCRLRQQLQSSSLPSVQERAILRVTVVVPDEPQHANHHNNNHTNGNDHHILSPYTPKYRTKSQFSAPLDELVQEDLQTGTLDRLLSEVEKRNHYNFNNNYTTSNSSNSPQHVFDFPDGQQHTPPVKSSSPRSNSNNVKRNNDVKLERVPPATTTTSTQPAAAAAAVTKQRQPAKTTTAKTPVVLEIESIIQGAPVGIILAHPATGSVVSALTAPFLDDEDEVLAAAAVDHGSTADARSQAYKHEWIQAGLLNQGISQRIEALLQRTTSSTPPRVPPKVERTETQDDDDDKSSTILTNDILMPDTKRKAAASRKPAAAFSTVKESWDWLLTGISLCDCSSIPVMETLSHAPLIGDKSKSTEALTPSAVAKPSTPPAVTMATTTPKTTITTTTTTKAMVRPATAAVDEQNNPFAEFTAPSYQKKELELRTPPAAYDQRPFHGTFSNSSPSSDDDCREDTAIEVVSHDGQPKMKTLAPVDQNLNSSIPRRKTKQIPQQHSRPLLLNSSPSSTDDSANNSSFEVTMVKPLKSSSCPAGPEIQKAQQQRPPNKGILRGHHIKNLFRRRGKPGQRVLLKKYM